MQVKCEYCGSYINDLDEKCSACGAINPNYTRPQNEAPRTIEELKDWYKARNLPPEEVTRFFVGKNIKEPKAFGIYEENGTFYVYKNKADGTRAIRYQGADEAYAVNELYMRLKEEILNQKRNNLESKHSCSPEYSAYLQKKKRRERRENLSCFLLMFICSCILALIVDFPILKAYWTGRPLNDASSYYIYNNECYYYLDNPYAKEKTWYRYNDNDWKYYCSDKDKYNYFDKDYLKNLGNHEIGKNFDDLKNDPYFNVQWNVTNFDNTDWYASYLSDKSAYLGKYSSSYSSSSNYDSSWDWDSGSSWDSSSTDWDSDW